MNDSERKLFDESLEDCFDLYDSKPKDKGIWWSACHRYSLTEVAQAFMAHIQDPQWGNSAPKPAQIVGRLARTDNDGHLPADEAWAIAAKAMDESATVVMTQEIADAWGVAQEVMRLGDEVGARMAFRSAYERRVATSRADGRRPKWYPSLGHDPNKRAAALEEAAERLRLPHLAERAALEDKSPPSAQTSEWIARARLVMAMQAPRPSYEIPLDEIVAALPEDKEGRNKALVGMTPSQENRVRHVLREAEKQRQSRLLHAMITPAERGEYERKKAAGLLPSSHLA